MYNKIITILLILAILSVGAYIVVNRMPTSTDPNKKTYTVTACQTQRWIEVGPFPIPLKEWIIGDEYGWHGNIAVSNSPIFSFPNVYVPNLWGDEYKAIGILTDPYGTTYEQTTKLSSKYAAFTLKFHNVPYSNVGYYRCHITVEGTSRIGPIVVGESVMSSVTVRFVRDGEVVEVIP